jgi:hypothetical protein
MSRITPPGRFDQAVVKKRRRVGMALAGAMLRVLTLAVTHARARAGTSLTERQKIDALISRIEMRTDLRFERNGISHTAAEAGRHLRMKLDIAGARITTAREFIAQIGTESSLTRLEYRIRLADGNRVPSAEFLRAELASIEAEEGEPGATR